jgi:hypothetical protein
VLAGRRRPNSDAHGHANEHAYAFDHTDAHGYADRHCYGHAYSDLYGYGHADSHSVVNAFTDADADTGAAGHREHQSAGLVRESQRYL